MKRKSVMVALFAGLAVLLSAAGAKAAVPSSITCVRSLSSGKVLDDPGWSQSNGTLIQQWDANGGTNQQWQFFYLGNGFYAIYNVASGKYLDMPGGSMNDGTPVQQYQWNGGWNQQWGVTIWAVNYTTAGTFYTVVIYNRNSSKYLDVPSSSTSNGTIIQQYHYTGGRNQQWILGPY